jgi:hypothetical protein
MSDEGGGGVVEAFEESLAGPPSELPVHELQPLEASTGSLANEPPHQEQQRQEPTASPSSSHPDEPSEEYTRGGRTQASRTDGVVSKLPY